MSKWVLLLLIVHNATGQIDDLIDGTWSAPALDIIERRRDDPLCLRCCSAKDLTEIPGISQRLASKIVRVAGSGRFVSLSELSDSLCLSPDQFSLLSYTTTLSCECGGLISSADVRIRAPTDRDGLGLARIDISHRYGRAGFAYSSRVTDPSPTYRGWFQLSYGVVDLLLGDVAMRLGNGLLIGTARGLSRGPADILSGIGAPWALRPWTSRDRNGALRGAAFHISVPNSTVGFLCAHSLRETTQGVEQVSTVLASSLIAGSNVSVGLVNTQPMFNKQSALLTTLSVVHRLENGTVSVEMGMDQTLRISAQAHAESSIDRSDVGVSAWWYNPDLTLPLGTALAQSPSPQNGLGVAAVFRQRFTPRASVTSTLSYSERVSRSYLTPLPASSFDWIVDLSLRPATKSLLSARIRYEGSTQARPTTSVRVMDRSTALSLRADYETAISSRMHVRFRIDLRTLSWQSQELEPSGLLFYLLFRYDVSPSLSFRIQWAQFHADTYSVAPRMLAPTVPGAFTPVVATGTGGRRTITARWQWMPSVGLSMMAYDDARVVNNERRSDLGLVLQLDVRLRPEKRGTFF